MTKQEKIDLLINSVIAHWNVSQNLPTDWQPLYGGASVSQDLLLGLHSQGVVIKVECPDCSWNELKDEELVGMTPCYRCNSTGYILEPLIEEG